MASIPSHEFHDLDDNMMSTEKEFAAMDVDLAQLKQRIPLLEYLQRRNWTGCRVGAQQEFVGLCPLHPDTRPSFYVNARKNLFYCHGCQRGGDLIRFVEISHHLSFRESLAYLQRDIAVVADSELLEKTAAFYRLQLHRHPEAVEYLQQRGLQDPDLIEELGIGYAPGGNLRRHLADLGYSFALLRRTGLINHQGRDAFCRRVMFPCRQQGRVINLYGRSIGTAFPHRLLPRSKGGLFAWESVRAFSTVILVEGLFDLAVLWQADFRNVTCAIGTHLTPAQLSQLCEPPGRCIYIAFDHDANQAGQQASRLLARLLESTGLQARIVPLPPGHDPNSYFAGGATASDFLACMEQSQSL
jgi:DNA primase